MKGITLNYENSKVVNFTTLSDMILKDTTPVHIHNPKKMKGNTVVSLYLNQKQRCTSLFSRSAVLWTTLSPCNMDMINLDRANCNLFIYLFIYSSQEKCNKYGSSCAFQFIL